MTSPMPTSASPSTHEIKALRKALASRAAKTRPIECSSASPFGVEPWRGRPRLLVRHPRCLRGQGQGPRKRKRRRRRCTARCLVFFGVARHPLAPTGPRIKAQGNALGKEVHPPQSLSRILLHVVFSTKKWVPMIPSDLMPDLHAFVAGACRKAGSDAFRVGGTANHVRDPP